jgi:hypothetical protein
MGAFSRLRDWFLGAQGHIVSTYPAWIDEFLTKLYGSTPGLTIGATYEPDPVNFPGIYAPFGANGEVEGEIYLSNDRSPAQVWIWQNSAWNGISEGAIYVPNTQHALVWDDLQGPVNQATGTAALTQEAYRDTPAFGIFCRHDQDDSLTFWLQMPHTWRRDTEVRVHAHFIPMSTPAANQVVLWSYSYAWAPVFGELPANVSWTTSTTPFTVLNDGSQTFNHQIHPLFSTTPTGTKESAFLVINVKRLGTNIGDTYNTNKVGGTLQANVCILGIDAHIQKEKVGTTTEIPV